jgi:hypothetical protein
MLCQNGIKIPNISERQAQIEEFAKVAIRV